MNRTMRWLGENWQLVLVALAALATLLGFDPFPGGITDPKGRYD